MKVLIFGPAGAGKTSLLRTTCLGYNFMKVVNLKPTKGISRENFIFRGIMELNVWDAGGQEVYMERYFSEKQRELVFSEVTTTIFMVDASVDDPKVREVFNRFLMNLFEFSPNIDQVYVLLNKIDLQGSKEDQVYKMLSENLDEDLEDKIQFTPVSVKEGSAQHRLIEILDFEIQKSTLSLQRLGKIRHILDQFKIDTLSEYLLFNRPDGLLIASTFGKFESKPLQFMKFEIGTLDSNMYQIYKKIMKLMNKSTISPLDLSTIIYESDNSHILIKEVANEAILMAVTKNKDQKVFFNVMESISGEKFDDLKSYFKEQEIY